MCTRPASTTMIEPKPSSRTPACRKNTVPGSDCLAANRKTSRRSKRSKKSTQRLQNAHSPSKTTTACRGECTSLLSQAVLHPLGSQRRTPYRRSSAFIGGLKLFFISLKSACVPVARSSNPYRQCDSALDPRLSAAIDSEGLSFAPLLHVHRQTSFFFR